MRYRSQVGFYRMVAANTNRFIDTHTWHIVIFPLQSYHHLLYLRQEVGQHFSLFSAHLIIGRIESVLCYIQFSPRATHQRRTGPDLGQTRPWTAALRFPDEEASIRRGSNRFMMVPLSSYNANFERYQIALIIIHRERREKKNGYFMAIKEWSEE